jgi:CRP/FNR family transcriptional regulator
MSGAAIACERCPVADRAVCAVLDQDERERLVRIGRRRRFVRGETILAAGDDSASFGTLVSGAAKLSSIDRDGTERIVALVHPAGTLGQLFGATERLSVTALGECEVCLFPRATFEVLAGEQPALAARLLQDALASLEESRSLIDLISHREARGRVAGLLRAFARAASTHGCHDAAQFELPLTRGEMAQLLGLTIETVSRTLTGLERDGTIRRDGPRRIAILSPDRLAEVG